MSHLPTPGQTVGPFFGYALPYDGGEDLVPAHHPNAVRLHGTVYDGDVAPMICADGDQYHWNAPGAGLEKGKFTPPLLQHLSEDNLVGDNRCHRGPYKHTGKVPRPAGIVHHWQPDQVD